MSTYQTHKNTAAARRETLARRQARNAKSAATYKRTTTRAGRAR